MSEFIRNISYTITTGKVFPEPYITPQAQTAERTGISFKELLDARLENSELTFSKHAAVRTQERNIQLSRQDLDRLGGAVDRAREKGLRDTLIFMNDSAFIVNVPNKVVVTVMDNSETIENVFTNIDGAVIL